MNTLSRTTALSPDAPATCIAQPVTAPSRSVRCISNEALHNLYQFILALFSAGSGYPFAFALLYCIQPILPVLSAAILIMVVGLLLTLLAQLVVIFVDGWIGRRAAGV